MSKFEDEGVPDQEDVFKIKASDVKKIKSIGKGELNLNEIKFYIE